MKLKLKITGLSIVTIIFLMTTLIFAILSILNNENIYLRIITPFSAFLSWLFMGLFAIVDLKNKSLGYIFFAVSVITLASVISTYLFLIRNGSF